MWGLNKRINQPYKATLIKEVKETSYKNTDKYVEANYPTNDDLAFLFELKGTEYVRTTDTEIVREKTYYIRTLETNASDDINVTTSKAGTENRVEEYNFSFAYGDNYDIEKSLDIANTWADHSVLTIKTTAKLNFANTDKVIIDGLQYSVIGAIKEPTNETNNYLSKPEFITIISLKV